MSDYFQELSVNPDSGCDISDDLINRFLRYYHIFRDENGGRTAPKASKTAVAKLKTRVMNEYQCPICLKRQDEGVEVKELPCKHTFHSECILIWLNKTNSCPSCRYELETDDEDYEAYRKEKLRAKQRELEIETLHDSMFS